MLLSANDNFETGVVIDIGSRDRMPSDAFAPAANPIVSLDELLGCLAQQNNKIKRITNDIRLGISAMQDDSFLDFETVKAFVTTVLVRNLDPEDVDAMLTTSLCDGERDYYDILMEQIEDGLYPAVTMRDFNSNVVGLTPTSRREDIAFMVAEHVDSMLAEVEFAKDSQTLLALITPYQPDPAHL